MHDYQLFATTPKAMDQILARELETLGASNIKQSIAGVAFNGSLATAYKICLWSRCANRILLVLDNFTVTSQEDLYRGIQQIPWYEHFSPDDSFAVNFSARNAPAFNNTHFGALKVKDAIVDQMRERFNKRPDIDTVKPDIRINLYLQGEKAQLSLDLSGESLHKRGYRDTRVAAPIKENLAAAMLLLCKWPEIAQNHGTLLDPMCGSGTLLIEGALIAADIAPGLFREDFGFNHWKQHDTELWQKLHAEAEQRRETGIQKLPVIVGFDTHRGAINAAKTHIAHAGLQDKIHVERRDISAVKPAAAWIPGLVICNPPYGERLGNEQEAAELYRQLGDMLKKEFMDWQAGLIISNPELGFRLGIRSQKPLTLYNGALECKLLRLRIIPEKFFIPKNKNRQQRLDQISHQSDDTPRSLGAEMFANRLQKNLKKWRKWAKRNQIDCYRLYDADLPEYALAIDIYQNDSTWINVQEYEAPKSIDKHKADVRLAEAMTEIPEILGVDREQVFLKMRRRQKKSDQYEKLDDQGQFHIIEEHGCRLRVNFENYLDTGLFLDHRLVREMIQQLSANKHFLNLFAYTGTATVHAAKGGALSTTTVDMSRTYLDWAKKNQALNMIRGHHDFIQADCMAWLSKKAKQPTQHYDLIFLDPPTFSNSKRMEQTFDIQNDHVQLIDNASKLLTPDGILLFSTNFRRFQMDTSALSHLKLEDISKQTIPEDFARNPRIHYCWKICL